MWTILLVEDEPFVRRSVRNAIPWEEAGFTIVAEASHGREAMSYIEELNPDIVITDIFMPYMDGIELLQTARSQGSEASFIMLTCANDFEHARLALEHGATSYILKLSMDDDEMLRALGKAKEQLEKRKAGERLRRSQFQDCMPLLWRHMLGKELAAAEALRLAEFRRSQRQFGSLTIAAGLTGARNVGYEELCRLHPTVTAKASTVLSHSEAGLTTWFLWEEGTATPRPDIMRLPHEELELVCKAAAPDRPLENEWLQALAWLDDDYYGRRGCSGARVCGNAAPAALPVIPWGKEQEVIRSFEGMRLAECEGRLAELWAFMEQERLPMALVKETAVRLDRIMSRISRKPTMESAGLLETTGHRDLLDVMIARMKQYGKGMSGQRPPATDHPEVNKIISYLLQNYDREISLQAMAQYVNIDENYLSGLFKKKTGDTFINYLQKLRVEEAKFYLAHTDLTVAELSERAGFANPSYFFKVFKRWAGVTPNEYRTAHKQADGNR